MSHDPVLHNSFGNILQRPLIFLIKLHKTYATYYVEYLTILPKKSWSFSTR